MSLAKIAEHVVSTAIERVSELLNHETASVAARVRVRDDWVELRAELKQIRRSLASRVSVRRAGGDAGNEQIQSWLKEVIDVAYEVSDVVDTFVVKLDSSSCAGALRIRVGGVGGRVKSILSRIREIKEIIVRLGSEIEVEISTSATKIEGPGRRIRNPDGGDYLDEHDIFVGVERNVEALKAMLMEETDGLKYVSIVGMGGIGKTTLAKHVSGLREVRQHFDCYAWVYVSQTPELSKILYEILVQVGFRRHYERNGRGKSDGFKEYLQYLDSKELIEYVRVELEEKRYLVVFDDVWHIGMWSELRLAFPLRGKNGSKVVFTTRSVDVARNVDSPVLTPKLLSQHESLQLLARKALGDDPSYSEQFETLSREIVSRYTEGLPLLIILLGGLLRTKSSLDEWKQVQQHLNEHLLTAESAMLFSSVYNIMAVCYNDLPCHLIPCLLYFVTFPYNREVPKQELIRYWIAEGFIRKPRREGETMESIAEGYLGELINRCMVQVVKRDHIGVGVKTCQMHDLVRDFCLGLASRGNFVDIVLSRRGVNLGADFPRRIVVQDESNFDSFEAPHHSTRSLLRFTVDDRLPISNWWSLVLRKFRLLRVLELGFITGSCDDHQPTKLPREIGKLVYLKYLGLRGVCISTLPSSIGNLRYLHTLDLRRVGITELPHSIGKLQSLYTLDLRGNKLQSLPKTMSRLTCLRHLLLPALQSYMPASPNSVRSCFRMHKLKNLQTLKFVQAGTLIRCDAVLRLTNIQNLKIEFRSSQEVRAVLASPIVELNRLRSLSLLSYDTFPSLESLSRCSNLRKLGLHGTLSEEGIHFLPKELNKLLLSKSNMMQDPMTVLQKMRNLRFLRLGKNAYNGSEMACIADSFPKLETLQLVGLPKLQKWHVERGSMPSLMTLDIENTHKLTTLPEELKSLPSLRDLNITDVRETSGVEPEAEDGARGENLTPARRLQPAPSFSLNVGNMPPTISVHLIVAEISSAVGR